MTIYILMKQSMISEYDLIDSVWSTKELAEKREDGIRARENQQCWISEQTIDQPYEGEPLPF